MRHDEAQDPMAWCDAHAGTAVRITFLSACDSGTDELSAVIIRAAFAVLLYLVWRGELP